MVAVQPRHECFGEGTCGEKIYSSGPRDSFFPPLHLLRTESNIYFYPSSVFLSFPCNFQIKVLTLLLSLQLNSTCPSGHPIPLISKIHCAAQFKRLVQKFRVLVYVVVFVICFSLRSCCYHTTTMLPQRQ